MTYIGIALFTEPSQELNCIYQRNEPRTKPPNHRKAVRQLAYPRCTKLSPNRDAGGLGCSYCFTKPPFKHAFKHQTTKPPNHQTIKTPILLEAASSNHQNTNSSERTPRSNAEPMRLGICTHPRSTPVG